MGRSVAYILLLTLLIPHLKAQDTAVHHLDTRSSQLTITLVKEALGATSGFCDEALHSPVKVKVSDESGTPVAGIEVAFSIIAQPDQAKGSGLSSTLNVTDSMGFTQAELILGSKPGTCEFIDNLCN